MTDNLELQAYMAKQPVDKATFSKECTTRMMNNHHMYNNGIISREEYLATEVAIDNFIRSRPDLWFTANDYPTCRFISVKDKSLTAFRFSEWNDCLPKNQS